jgi:F0F1-type ATP synthase membrane subunit b/b'
LVRRAALQVGRRLQSTTTQKASETAQQTASKAKDTASEYTAKAAQGLSRVTSSAGPAIANAAKGVSGALGKIGGRTGRLVAFVERQVPLVIYYSKVGLEVGRLVVRGQKMTPPSVATFQSYFQTFYKQLLNPSTLFRSAVNSSAAQTATSVASKAASNPQSVLQQARNINRGQLIAGGVVVAECLGFFTVGEMIGRMKLVGYHGETGAHH